MKNKMLPALLLLMAGLLFTGIPAEAKNREDVIPGGVYAEGVELSGMTKEEAKKAVSAYTEGKAEEKITLNVEEDALEVTRAELGVSWNNEEIIDEAFSLGKSGNLIQRYKALKDLEVEKKVYDLTYTADKELIQAVVTEKCTRYNKNAVNMGLHKTESGFEVIEGKQGVVVDEEKAVTAVAEFIETEFSEENTQMRIPTKISQPKEAGKSLRK